MPIDLSIVTPEGESYRESVDRVVFPGSEGEFEVLEGHERFLTPLQIGEVRIRRGGETRYAAVSGGFADVGGERVVAMVDTCELAEEIDVERAEQARDRARAVLDGPHGRGEAEAQRYRVQEFALQRALVRLQVAMKGR